MRSMIRPPLSVADLMRSLLDANSGLLLAHTKDLVKRPPVRSLLTDPRRMEMKSPSQFAERGFVPTPIFDLCSYLKSTSFFT